MNIELSLPIAIAIFTSAMIYSVITGASRGIGKAIAEELASRGHSLILVSLAGEDLATTSESIRQKYKVDVQSFESDLSVPGEPARFFAWLESHSFRINILVNNAGFGTVGPFHEIPIESEQKMTMVNVFAVVTLTQILLPLLMKEEKAWIMNMSSMASFLPTPYKATYGATKAFVLSFSRALHLELKNSNVSVTCICPNGVLTNSEIRKRISSAGILIRMSSMEPEAVAKSAVKGLFRGKQIVIPGFLNKVQAIAISLIPFSLYSGTLAKKIARTNVKKK